jgi:predicted DNA-binding transcriptional regulator AlpA
MVQLLTRREVVALIGRSPSSIYRDEKRGHFPARRRLPGGAARWRRDEIEQWLASLPTAADADKARTDGATTAAAPAARVAR